MKAKLYSMAFIAMMICAGITSCSKDEGGSGSDISQQPSATPSITIEDGQKFQFGVDNVVDYTAQQISMAFSTNMDWSISGFTTNGDWCTVSSKSGKAGKSNILFNIAKNEDSEDRTNTFTISCGTLSKTIKITQKGQNTLTLSTSNFEVPLEGGTIDVQVLSNIDFTIEIEAGSSSWIHKTTKEVDGKTSHNYFDVDASEEYNKREGVIIVSSSLGEEKVNVYQSGSSILLLSESQIEVSADGGTVYVHVSSNFDYGIRIDNPDWIHSGSANRQRRAVATTQFILSVDKNDTYEPRSGVVVVYDKNSDKKETVTIIQEEKTRPETKPSYVEAVDLGLPSGLLWASMNVGAKKNNEDGTYVSWGETEGATCIDPTEYKWEGKLDFTIENYKYYKSSTETSTDNGFTETTTYSGYTKYVCNSAGYKGYKDNKTTLDPEDDFATVSWGGKWKTPTAEDMLELKNNCTWSYGSIDGINGCKITGPNGKWIFIPSPKTCEGESQTYFSGAGGLLDGNTWKVPHTTYESAYCWSRTAYDSEPYYLNAGNGFVNITSMYSHRYMGVPVRPVRKK